MKKITTTPITDAMYVSGPPETDYAAYNAATAYSFGNRVIRTSTHRIYESLVAGAGTNTGNTPETSPTQWLDIGPTNRWAAFDNVIGTATATASPLTFVLAPGQVRGLMLADLVGTAVEVSMTSASEGGATVYARTVSLDASAVLDYDDWFFAPFEQTTVVVLTDLPPYVDGVITVTVTGIGTVQVGVLMVGSVTQMGETNLGASGGITSYSVKSEDAFGHVVVTKRSFAKRQNYTLRLKKAEINRVARRLYAADSELAVWIGSEDPDFAELLVGIGFFKSFNIEVDYRTLALCSMEIEGIV